jgi:signal transduction histidine kinase
MRPAFAAPQQLGKLAIQFGWAFALAMIVVGMVGFGAADRWVSGQIDSSLQYHMDKYLSDVDRDPAVDTKLEAKILEWQHRKVLSERTYLLFDRSGALIAGRLDITPPPPGFADVRFTGGGKHYVVGRALATRLRSGSLFVIVQHSEAAASLNALLPIVVISISLVALLIGVIATVLFARLTAKRLAETQDTAVAIAAGDLTRRIPTERLDGMFAVQAESLNHMLDRMEDLVKAQQLFSSNLAHDLRTPLTRLRGMLASASAERKPDLPAVLDNAERECASIIGIFEALLRLAEIETGQHPTAMTPLSLRAIIEDAAETMEPVIGDRGGALVVDRVHDTDIIGDADLINQLLINLLENVANHTPAGTCATLSLERDGSDAVIVVGDDGPGLSPSDLVRVTRPFERGVKASSGNGSGLGLAIASAIAKFHGGRLELANEQSGLSVRIRLPVAAKPASPGKSSPQNSVGSVRLFGSPALSDQPATQ